MISLWIRLIAVGFHVIQIVRFVVGGLFLVRGRDYDGLPSIQRSCVDQTSYGFGGPDNHFIDVVVVVGGAQHL